MLTAAARRDFDNRAAGTRRLEVPKEALKMAAGGKPSGVESQMVSLMMLRLAPSAVIVHGKRGLTHVQADLWLSEIGLVGNTPLPSGAKVRGWHAATRFVRYILGGSAAVSTRLTDKARRKAIRIQTCIDKYYLCLTQAFDGYTYHPGGLACPTAGEAMVWKYYLIERLAEERHIARILFEKVQEIGAAHGVNVAVRFLFCHFLLRLITGLYAEVNGKPPMPLFVASAESVVLDICKDQGPRSQAGLLDELLKGKAYSKK